MKTTPAVAQRQAIEQARARGLSVTETALHLGIDYGTVEDAWSRQDAEAGAADLTRADEYIRRRGLRLGPRRPRQTVGA